MTPASLPANPEVSDDEGNFSAEPLTEEIEPVTETFFWVPAPTTTTVSSSLSGVSSTSTTPSTPMSTVRVL